MPEPHQPNRRDFLTGKAALEAVGQLADRANGTNKETATPDADAPPRAREGYLLKLTRQAMACEFQVFLNIGQYADGPERAVEALDLIEQLEDQLTVYRDHSEVSRLNQRGANEAVPLEAELFALLEQAVQLHQETSGAYDITSGPLTKVWGFNRREGRIPQPEELTEARQRVGSQHLLINPAERTARFARPGIEINLGSIGKGYALDRAAAHLLTGGVRDFLWHGGNSSVLGHGAASAGDPGWTVGLRHPLQPSARIGQFTLREQALGTSGTVAQFFLHQGKRYGHILDPRTGYPAEVVLSATVLAPTAALADALSTAFFVAGPAVATEYCATHPEVGVAVILPGEKAGGITVERINLPEASLTLY